MNQVSWIKEEFIEGLVSVIIPVYNRDLLIKEAVASISNQSYRPIECLIVDDGSTDNTAETIQKLIKENQDSELKIKLYKQTNSGAPVARNKGLINSRGEFIQFLDSDDLLYPNKIQEQVDCLVLESELDGVYGDWHHGVLDNFELIYGEQWEDPIEQFYGGRVVHTLSFLFRRCIINKVGQWDTSLKRNQEVDYFLRAAIVGGRFKYLNRVAGLWREHDGERIVSSIGAMSVLKFHDKWFEEFKNLDLLNAERKKTMAHFYFWYTMRLEHSQKEVALNYLYKTIRLYKGFPEFQTGKMKVLRAIFGWEMSLKYWYERANSS
ncbi:MAG: glycosyltransferase [Bacteroidota bacterium]